jgi:uncharacterized protein YegP (UPF0339 family)
MASRLPRIEIYVDDAGGHRWRLLSRNGRAVAESAESYSSRTKLRRALGATLAMLGVDENGDRLGGGPAQVVDLFELVDA